MTFSRRLRTFLCLPAISALVLDASRNIAVPTASSSLNAALSASGLKLSAISNQSDHNDASIHCESGAGRQYGSPQPMSCADSWEDIPKGTTLQFFGNRGIEVQGSIGLPYRFISSDGDCIIDIDYVGREGNTDLEAYSRIGRIAETIILQCVSASGGVPHGGVAIGLGAQGKLTVTVQQYYPKVHCYAPSRLSRALNVTACQKLLDGMLTTTSSQIFGERGNPGVEVPLTKRFSSASGDCSIALLMDGPPISMTWYEIWGAAVAVAGMCVRFSKLGTAVVQSGNSIISVAFGRAFT